MNEKATAIFRKTLEESGRLSLGDALLLALYEAAQAAGSSEVSLKVRDGDLTTAEVYCGE